nr:6-phospho-beta-glucosidase [uncultured bacterium]
MVERITILGGSSVYAPEFLMSVIARNLNVKEICLFGRPGRKLEVVAKFCQRLVKKSGFPVQVIPSSNIAEAVTGAKYVINHVRVGGMQARMRDEMLPPKLGMIGDESLGAGGITNALRTIPVVLDQALQVQEANPFCTYINLTNPMGVVVEALLRYTKLNVIGACDMPGQCVRKVAEVLQQDPEKLKVEYVGLNQIGWIQDIKFDGRSRMGHLLELLEERRDEDLDYDLIELFRMVPTRNAALYYRRAEALKRQQVGAAFRSELLHEAEKQILKLYDDPRLNDVPDLTRQRNAVWYQETILPVIDALEGRKESTLILSVRNGQCIRDLPEDCCIEAPALVNPMGVQPRKTGSLPKFLRGLFISVKESERLIIEAVKHRSYEYALQALVINPYVPSIDVAKKFLDRAIKEEKFELH